MNFIDNLKDFFMPADDNEPETPSMTPPEPERLRRRATLHRPLVTAILVTAEVRLLMKNERAAMNAMQRSRQLHSFR